MLTILIQATKATETAGYRLNRWLSVGAGVGILHAALDQEAAVNNSAVPGQAGLADGKLKLDADDVGYNFNLFQDPYERADITSNTFWDWQLDHIGSMYGVMDDVFKFAETFDEFPPRSYPPSFNPANIMEHKLRMIQVEQELRKAFPILPEPVKPEPKN
jgi:long-subunit fatty acid transport protein